MMQTAIVIPCFNEAKRIRIDEFSAYIQSAPNCILVFVNDGSTDGTLGILHDFQRKVGRRAEVVNKSTNGGKAEAVRAGLIHVVRTLDLDMVGFWDADLATPLNAIDEFRQVMLGRPEVEMVFGSRVKLLGRNIDRRASRHYLGRLFATAASIALDLPIYDTQCGAKLFRVTPKLREVLREPFRSKWIFDVELIARFLRLNATDQRWREYAIYEHPLTSWTDIAGSKLCAKDFVRAAGELVQLYAAYSVKRSAPAVGENVML